MSDKVFTAPNGKNYQALKHTNNSYQVKAEGVMDTSTVSVETETQFIDHETQRIQWNRGNKRGLFWIYAVRNKRVLAWPGGSMELDSQDLSDGTATSSGTLKPLKLTMPGKVLNIKVKEGDVVDVGQGLVVVEAMKMENILLSAAKAKIGKIHVNPGDRLESGATLISFEPA